jgi:hypothetical protein
VLLKRNYWPEFYCLLPSPNLIKLGRSVWWFSDASGIGDFIRGPPPENKRRLRWWYFLRSFNLEIRHVSGAANELADFLSRAEWSEKFGIKLNEMAKKAFEKMDECLDLALIPAISNFASWSPYEVIEEYPDAAPFER